MTAPALPIDSAVCVAAADLLDRSSPPVLVRHCYRTHALGAALLAGRRLDPEILFVAAALHDLGLAPDYATAEVAGFELVGAAAAEQLMSAHGADGRRARLAGEAVELHLELSSAQDPRPEVAAVHLGAALDVLGLSQEQLPAGVLDAVLERWPRAGFPTWLAQAMQAEADARPRSRTAVLVRDAALLALIERAELPR